MPNSYAFRQSENPNFLLWPNWLNSNNKAMEGELINAIAHIWTGNLVSNINWENVWLAEGFSTFVERKILKQISGEVLFNLTAYKGAKKLDNFIRLKGENNTWNSLHPIISNNTEPNLAVNIVAKEKGFLFLHYLEVNC
jgi:leukotriene-A4 hydrolase